MKPERVMDMWIEIREQHDLVSDAAVAFARRIEAEVLREAADVADSFVRSGDWDNDCCVGIRESILELIPESPNERRN